MTGNIVHLDAWRTSSDVDNDTSEQKIEKSSDTSSEGSSLFRKITAGIERARNALSDFFQTGVEAFSQETQRKQEVIQALTALIRKTIQSSQTYEIIINLDISSPLVRSILKQAIHFLKNGAHHVPSDAILSCKVHRFPVCIGINQRMVYPVHIECTDRYQHVHNIYFQVPFTS